jgi:phenylacetate-coenzyme A ligase PaaK-like adenylate-forming protein
MDFLFCNLLRRLRAVVAHPNQAVNFYRVFRSEELRHCFVSGTTDDLTTLPEGQRELYRENVDRHIAGVINCRIVSLATLAEEQRQHM